MNRLAVLSLLVASTTFASDDQLKPIRIAIPAGGHIHPSICVSHSGTIVVTYGRVKHVDLRITRSSDVGAIWSKPVPFVHTVKKTYYPGSLTTLSDGRLLHCWDRWDTPTTQKEPRSVLYSLSNDDGQTWDGMYEYYNPGRVINGRTCPRTVQLDDETIGVVFYDIDKDQEGGPVRLRS